MRRQPTAFRAVLDGYGDADAVRIEEVPRPQPGDHEVLVQVVAAGISHMDLYLHQGRFREELPLTFPTGEGTSFAGIVRARGAGVREFKVGDEVLGHDPRHGAHATWLVVDAGAVVKKPPRVGWEVASALYLPGLTAYELVQSLRLGADDVVVVSAAAGGVGHVECQLARLAGATVIGVAGAENHDYLRSIGVKPVTYGDGLEERIRKAADGRPVTALIDNFGGYDALAGALDVPASRLVASDARRDVEIRLWSADGDPSLALRLRDVAELISEWNVRVLVSGFHPFRAIGRALADLDARHSRGVVVVGMRTTAPEEEYLRGTARAHHEARAAEAAAASTREQAPAR